MPIQFSTIGKTLLSLNPILKALDPNFEPNKVLQEQSSEIINKRLYRYFSPQSFNRVLLDTLDFIQQLPNNLNEIVNKLVQNDVHFKIHFLESEALSKNFEKIANRITMGLILASLVIAAALLMRIQTAFTLFGYPGFAMLMFLLAASGSIFLILSILINDRKEK